MLDLFAGRLGWAIPFLERGAKTRTPENAANARIIAAAPAMLKALEQIRDGAELCECEHDTPDCCVNVGYAKCAFCFADKAIRAAVGAQEENTQ